MLNEEVARGIEKANRRKNKKAVVFAPGKYLGQRELTKMGITFCQLPYGIAGGGVAICGQHLIPSLGIARRS